MDITCRNCAVAVAETDDDQQTRHRCAVTGEYVDLDALYARDPIADKLQYSKMLLLDDFGVEYASDWVMSRFQAFVEYRHANMLSTCITTNLSVADLSTLPGYERVISRWAESCGNDIYELPGRDLRRAHPAA